MTESDVGPATRTGSVLHTVLLVLLTVAVVAGPVVYAVLVAAVSWTGCFLECGPPDRLAAGLAVAAVVVLLALPVAVGIATWRRAWRASILLAVVVAALVVAIILAQRVI